MPARKSGRHKKGSRTKKAGFKGPSGWWRVKVLGDYMFAMFTFPPAIFWFTPPRSVRPDLFSSCEIDPKLPRGHEGDFTLEFQSLEFEGEIALTEVLGQLHMARKGPVRPRTEVKPKHCWRRRRHGNMFGRLRG